MPRKRLEKKKGGFFKESADGVTDVVRKKPGSKPTTPQKFTEDLTKLGAKNPKESKKEAEAAKSSTSNAPKR